MEKRLVAVEQELPGHDQLEELARSIATEDGELPESDELTAMLDAAPAPNRYEAATRRPRRLRWCCLLALPEK